MKRLTTLLIIVAAFLCLIISNSYAIGTWTKICSDPVGTVVQIPGHGLFATKLPEGNIYKYRPHTIKVKGVDVLLHEWDLIGNPGKKFVVVRNQLYALSPGGGVWWYRPKEDDIDNWDPIPLPTGIEKMSNIYGGPTGLFAIDSQTADIYAYNCILSGAFKTGWLRIGGPGKFAVGGEKGEFAAATRYLYGVEPASAGSKVRQFNFKNDMKWEIIGPNPAVNIYAGGEKLYATNPSGNIHEYNRQTNSWPKIGGPGKKFVVDKVTGAIYGLATDGSHVNKYTGTAWITIREAPTGSIFAGVGGLLYATDAATKELWAYVDNPFTTP